jgi:hypothetical protein
MLALGCAMLAKRSNGDTTPRTARIRAASSALQCRPCPHRTDNQEFPQTKNNERSQEVIENKGDRFIANCKSQQVYENKGFISVKPTGA